MRPDAGEAPEQIGPDGILGAIVSGDLFEWSRRDGGRLWLAYPEPDLSHHAVVVGTAGSGKTETLLRVAYIAARAYRWRVVVLDGSWAFEDAPACYLLLEGLALKAEAARLGRFFLEDFAHYAGVRKSREDRVLLVVDEFSALESTADAAHLFERLRSFGAAVVVSAQGDAGRGPAADRIVGAAPTLVLHRSAAPERLTARA